MYKADEKYWKKRTGAKNSRKRAHFLQNSLIFPFDLSDDLFITQKKKWEIKVILSIVSGGSVEVDMNAHYLCRKMYMTFQRFQRVYFAQ